MAINCSRANIASQPAIAISKDGRARAEGRFSPARSRRRRAPSPVWSRMCARFLVRDYGKIYDIYQPLGAASDRQYRYGPDHPRALFEDDFEGRLGRSAIFRLALRRSGKAE